MKIITLGNGYVASHLPYEIAKYYLSPNEEDVEQFIDEYDPDVVVNCTGFCGRPNVDQCESQKAITYMANVVMPAMLAQECERRAIHMIHIGSGCIYFGESPNKNLFLTEKIGNIIQPGDPNYFYSAFECADAGWKETDFANPKSYYTKTKYACDLAIGEMKNVTTLRIRMPISTQNNPRNFINKIRGYSNIIDIPNSVTFLNDLARCVDWAIKNNKTGIYHVTNPEPLSAADVMKEYQKYVPTHTFSIIDEVELDRITIAKRSNCIINTDKLQNAGFSMTPSKEALTNCMAQYIKNI